VVAPPRRPPHHHRKMDEFSPEKMKVWTPSCVLEFVWWTHERENGNREREKGKRRKRKKIQMKRLHVRNKHILPNDLARAGPQYYHAPSHFWPSDCWSDGLCSIILWSDQERTIYIKQPWFVYLAHPPCFRAPPSDFFVRTNCFFLQVWAWALPMHFTNAPLFYSFTLLVLLFFYFYFYLYHTCSFIYFPYLIIVI
jgi:hypothetical protein